MEFFTCWIFNLTSVPTPFFPASLVSAISYVTHNLHRVPVVSALPATLLQLFQEAPFPSLALAVSAVAALPSLTTVESFKPIPVSVTPVFFITWFETGA